jgi:heparosan-N-sulfate-glucuronate 5-epimerase
LSARGPWPARALELVRDGYHSIVGGGIRFTHQPLGKHVDPDGLRGYYCDFRHKAEWALTHPDGFPRVGGKGRRAEWVIPVAQCALGYWELMLEGQPMREYFLRLADWLVADAVEHDGGVLWPAPFPSAKYGLEVGWGSAMGQGEAISVLLRAHDLTGDDRYAHTAVAGLEPLLVDVAAGGLARRLDGALVLEEYPTDRPCAVLNGWIFALLGVHELLNATGDECARGLRDESAAALVTLLPRYDIGWWSLYSLYDHGRPDLAKPFYQRLHPVLLDALDLAVPAPELGAFARRWEAQLRTPAMARVALDKLTFRLQRERHDRAMRAPA